MLTDKEKIELIIQDKHLNNTQFCSEVGIAQGTLSHIRSGRTEPTLNILRSVAVAFPDINPAWLFYGEGEMYKTFSGTTPSVEDTDAPSHPLNNINEESGAEVGQLPLFSMPSAASPAASTSPTKGIPSSMPPSKGVLPSAPSSSKGATLAATQLNLQEIVAETLRQQQRPQRKVIEVRIFFDDGTFETFSAK